MATKNFRRFPSVFGVFHYLSRSEEKFSGSGPEIIWASLRDRRDATGFVWVTPGRRLRAIATLKASLGRLAAIQRERKGRAQAASAFRLEERRAERRAALDAAVAAAAKATTTATIAAVLARVATDLAAAATAAIPSSLPPPRLRSRPAGC